MLLDSLAPEVTALLERLGYAPVRELGRGGMGVVLLAEQRSLERQVAVKLLLPQAVDPVLVRRFEREGRVYRDLSHPNLVRVFDFGFEGPLPYLVMEYIPGARTVADFIGRKLAAEDLWRLLTGILKALECIHRRRIIHRDLKPANVLVGEDGEPRLIDLGLVRELDANVTRLTRDGNILGTPAYGAPEQLFGETVGPSADVYSWALIAIELLAGRLVFSGAAADGVPVQIRLATGVPDPGRFIEGADALLLRLLTRCTSVDPAARPADAGAVLEQLAKIVPRSTPGPLPEEPAGPEPDQATTQITPVPLGRHTSPSIETVPAPPIAPRYALALTLFLVVLAAGAGFWLRPRLPEPTVASSLVAAPSEAGEVSDVTLSLEPGELALTGRASAPAELAVTWNAGAGEERLVRAVTGRFRIALPPRERLVTLRVRLGGHEVPLATLLVPHAERMVKVLEAVDFAPLWQKVYSLAARPYTRPEPTPPDFLPKSMTRELSRRGPVLELLLDSAPEDLQRRLLKQVYSMETLDALLGTRARRPATNAAELAGDWGEHYVGQADPRSTLQRSVNRPSTSARARVLTVNGKDPRWLICRSGPEFDYTAWCPPDPMGLMHPDDTYEVLWEQPPPAGPIAWLALETDHEAMHIVQSTFNGRYQVPSCRFVAPQDRPKVNVLVRIRRIPIWALQPGTNALKVHAARFPIAPELELRPTWFGSMAVLVEKPVRRD